MRPISPNCAAAGQRPAVAGRLSAKRAACKYSERRKRPFLFAVDIGAHNLGILARGGLRRRLAELQQPWSALATKSRVLHCSRCCYTNSPCAVLDAVRAAMIMSTARI